MTVGVQENPREKLVVNGPDEFKKMPEEYQNLVIRQMLVHTEGELSGADDFIQLFYPMTDDPYEKFVCCERGAEEVDHYMRGAKILHDLGVDTTFMLKTPLQERQLYGTEAVKDINTWAERGFFSFLGEAAVLEQLKEMLESSYKPIAEMAVPVIKDEKVHVAHGYRIIRDMCQTEEGRAEAQTALNRMWAVALDVFGKSDSVRSRLYLKWGLRKYSNEEARQRFIKMAAPKLEALGLTVPDNIKGRKFL